MIQQVVYVSRAVHPMGRGTDRDILSVARKRNAELGLTGFLFRTRTHYIQLLEGPAEAVGQVTESLRRDPRHTDFDVIRTMQADTRSFGRFAMGYDDVLQMRAAEFIESLKSSAISDSSLRAHVELLAVGRRTKKAALAASFGQLVSGMTFSRRASRQ
ncbi:BLUF domain-containing protein [Sagittula stellata]|uniref:BLUF domain-containing protein n=1 Tax=Sagittula stellata (strain ATCC 700073 / DSM 11524 / E-37) TaxID=388399 RepID=A3JXI1_SAGS3|nr:BLUF domain-containing protein [Sagittula stellata]EBA10217.1 hypothetical protein SSE37_19467 [Sagittula stellata E-37]